MAASPAAASLISPPHSAALTSPPHSAALARTHHPDDEGDDATRPSEHAPPAVSVTRPAGPDAAPDAVEDSLADSAHPQPAPPAATTSLGTAVTSSVVRKTAPAVTDRASAAGDPDGDIARDGSREAPAGATTGEAAANPTTRADGRESFAGASCGTASINAPLSARPARQTPASTPPARGEAAARPAGASPFSVNVSAGEDVSDEDISERTKPAKFAARAGLSLRLPESRVDFSDNQPRETLAMADWHSDQPGSESDNGSDLEAPPSATSSDTASFPYSPSASSGTGSRHSYFQPADVAEGPEGKERASGSRSRSGAPSDDKVSGKKRRKADKGSKKDKLRRSSSQKSWGSSRKRLSLETTVEVEPGVFEKTLSPLGQLVSMWYVAVFFLAPLLLLPIFLVNDTPEARCAYVIFVMAIFWVTEAVPIPVTSLIPIFILPMMGLLTARQASAQYFNDTSVLFLGGLTVAIAIETWDLHRRIALGVMVIVGAEPRWLMLGMMLVTWFLSMWISNTATTAMMLPIVKAVMEQISPQDRNTADTSKTEAKVDSEEKASEIKVNGEIKTTAEEPKATSDGGVDNGERIQVEIEPPDPPLQLSAKQLAKALSLAIAYAANVGGIGSLTGTGPNLVLLGQSQIVFEKVGLNTPISFATWMVFGLPLSIILVFVVWVWLQILFLRCRGTCDCLFRKDGKKGQERSKKVREAIRAEFHKLGPISFAEGTIIACFVILVGLWITRDLSGQGGWGILFPEGYVSDSTPAVIMAVLMFILPSRWPDALKRRKPGDSQIRFAVKPLLDWKTVHGKMPWSLYLLLGGGFALARAATDSGLSVWLGSKLSVFGVLNPWLILLVICYIVTFFTEITSNTAIATLMMPILAQLSVTLNVNPLFFMFPVAITTSFAFMLPVATPPNAIVFAFGAVRVIDMVMAGFVLNLVTVPILILASVTWGNAFFDFETLPPEFLTGNTSTVFNLSAI